MPNCRFISFESNWILTSCNFKSILCAGGAGLGSDLKSELTIFTTWLYNLYSCIYLVVCTQKKKKKKKEEEEKKEKKKSSWHVIICDYFKRFWEWEWLFNGF